MTTRGNYSSEDLAAAVKAVKDGGLSFSEASKIYNVPKPTYYS